MKNIYSNSIIGLDAIKNNDIATVNSKFLEIYSQPVMYESTDSIEEDEFKIRIQLFPVSATCYCLA